MLWFTHRQREMGNQRGGFQGPGQVNLALESATTLTLIFHARWPPHGPTIFFEVLDGAGGVAIKPWARRRTFHFAI
jgi:hypothetical protein